jgi:hypothetical protein
VDLAARCGGSTNRILEIIAVPDTASNARSWRRDSATIRFAETVGHFRAASDLYRGSISCAISQT